MPLIRIETNINAPIEICFDLSRSIDLHQVSTAQTNEKAIGGKTRGLINLNETVTWQATHFGIKQKLTAKITRFNRPFYFRDEQLKGAFKKLEHDHYFTQKEATVLMTDALLFESPLGTLGTMFNNLVLINYMRNFIIKRNEVIKDFAETGKWKQLLL